MGCCIAVALMIAWVRRAWFGVLPGRAPEEPGFAPAAVRPGPAARWSAVSGDGPAPTTATVPSPAPRRAALIAPSAVLAFAAVGVAVYAAAVALARTIGLAEPSAAMVPWAVRDGLLVAIAVVALLGAVRAGSDGFADPRGRTAPALVGIGGAWTVLGMLDMHLLAPFRLAGGDALADVVFHGAGSVAVLVGALIALRAARRSAPATRSTARRAPVAS